MGEEPEEEQYPKKPILEHQAEAGRHVRAEWHAGTGAGTSRVLSVVV